jgi:ribose/xylose/arabinose/galactoside ABC-type transport system permease subunit
MTEKQKNLRLFVPVYAIFFVIYLVACIIEPTFFTWENNVNLFTRITPLIIVGIAQTLVILTGGIDLSLGASIGLANVIAASLPFVNSPANIALWLLVPPLVGLGVGLVNGLIITRGGFPPLIVTLAAGAIWKGVSLFVLPEPGGEVSRGVAGALTGTLFNFVPVPLVILLVVVFLFQIVLRRTQFGRSVYAVGGNETIAIESGIAVDRVKIGVYALSGMLGGVAGMFLSGWMNSGDPLVGEPYILNSIAVAVIGGTSLSGGTGGVVGIIGGAYIFHLLNNILNLLAVSTFYQYVAKGLILIAALAVTSTGAGIRLGSIFRKRREAESG